MDNTLKKVNDAYALYLADELLNALGWREGEPLSVSIEEDALVIRKRGAEMRLSDYFTQENSTSGQAYDWGKAAGEEVL